MRELSPEVIEKEIVRDGGTAIVEFWADWCIYCRLLRPKTERLARTFGDRTVVGRLNVEEHAGVARDLGIELLPAIAFFRHGERVQTWYGDLPVNAITDFVSQYDPGEP